MPLNEDEKALTVEAAVTRSGTATVVAEAPIVIGFESFNRRGSKSEKFDKAYVERRLVPVTVSDEDTVLEVANGIKRTAIDGWDRVVQKNPNVGNWSEKIDKLANICQANTGNCGPNSVAFLRYGGQSKVNEAPKECGKPLTRGALRMMWLDIRSESESFMIDIDKIETIIGECPADDAPNMRTAVRDSDNEKLKGDGSFPGSIARALNQFAPLRSDGERQKWSTQKYSDADVDNIRTLLTPVWNAGAPTGFDYVSATEIMQTVAIQVRDALAESPDGVMLVINIDDESWNGNLENYYRGNGDFETRVYGAVHATSSHWVVVRKIVPATDPTFQGIPDFEIFDPNSALVTARGAFLALSHAAWYLSDANNSEYGAIVASKPRQEHTLIKSGTALGAIYATLGVTPPKDLVAVPKVAIKADADAVYFNNYVEADELALKKAKDTGNLVAVVEAPPGLFAVVPTDCKMKTLLDRKYEEAAQPEPQPSDYFEKFRYGIASIRFIGKVRNNKFVVGDSLQSAAEFDSGERLESPTHRTKTAPIYVREEELQLKDGKQ